MPQPLPLPYLPQQSDIPYVRSLALSGQMPLTPGTLTFPDGSQYTYPMCVALVQDTAVAGQWKVALCVSSFLMQLDGATGVQWTPPANAKVIVVDIPAGFTFETPAALTSWLNKTPPADWPGGPAEFSATNVVVGVPSNPQVGAVALQVDIPQLQQLGKNDSIAPIASYVGCLLFAPDPNVATGWGVVLYVDQSLSAAPVPWPAGVSAGTSWVMYIPAGFSLFDDAGLQYWFNRLALAGGGGGGGNPVGWPG